MNALPAPGANDTAIVVPSHGRPESLAGCLAALALLEGGPYSIVVVDDGSPTPLARVCAEASGTVHCVTQRKSGPAAARNAGVAAAEGARTILFTDDDCRPRPDWARRMVAAQAGVPMRLVGGHVANALGGNLFSATSQSIQTYLYESFGTFGGGDAFFSSNNLCCRREDFMALGGFDPAFTFASEDRDFSSRWREKRGELVHERDAVVEHRHSLGPRSFIRQHWHYGRGGRRYHRRRSPEREPRILRNPARFYAGLLLHPLRREGPRGPAMSALVGAAHAAQLAGYLKERRSERRGQ